MALYNAMVNLSFMIEPVKSDLILPTNMRESINVPVLNDRLKLSGGVLSVMSVIPLEKFSV